MDFKNFNLNDFKKFINEVPLNIKADIPRNFCKELERLVNTNKIRNTNRSKRVLSTLCNCGDGNTVMQIPNPTLPPCLPGGYVDCGYIVDQNLYVVN